MILLLQDAEEAKSLWLDNIAAESISGLLSTKTPLTSSTHSHPCYKLWKSGKLFQQNIIIWLPVSFISHYYHPLLFQHLVFASAGDRSLRKEFQPDLCNCHMLLKINKYVYLKTMPFSDDSFFIKSYQTFRKEYIFKFHYFFSVFGQHKTLNDCNSNYFQSYSNRLQTDHQRHFVFLQSEIRMNCNFTCP